MPEHHATLSPSAAHRWISCPASIRMAAAIPKPTESASPWAQEGTWAHTVAELEAALAFDLITPRQHTTRWNRFLKEVSGHLHDDDIAAMRRHAADYVTFLQERVAAYPHSSLMLEQRLDTGVPRSWGTSDAVIFSPTHVEIVDYKYGLGIQVYADGNEQLRLYALGALDTYGDLFGDTQVVTMSIFQPRLEHVSSADMTPGELLAWREFVIPIAEEALTDGARFGPSESACKFCPAAGECRARMEAATAEDFSRDPDLLHPDEMGELLTRLPEIKAFCAAVEDAAMRKAYTDGVPIPGWKVVLSGGQRSIQDHDKALEILLGAGYDRDAVVPAPPPVKVRGIGELEKLLGKPQFAELLGPLAPKSAGRPALVPEADRREAVSPNTEAQKEFQ